MNDISNQVRNAARRCELLIQNRKENVSIDHPLFITLGTKSATGDFGEFMLDEMFPNEISPRLNGGHDRIHNTLGKLEIKTSKSITNNGVWFNQIKFDNDWDVMVFTQVKEDSIRAYHTKKDLLKRWEHISENNHNDFKKVFNHVVNSDIFNLLYEGYYS